ncbi:MAG: Piwi domain-containing protein, partial [Monoraphidium minutum]
GGGGGGGLGGELEPGKALSGVVSQLRGLTLTARPTSYDPANETPYQRAVRPGLGQQGRPVTVVANHFALSLKAKQAFHYDIAVSSLDPEGGKGGKPGGRPPPRKALDPAQANRPLPRPLMRRVLNKLAEDEGWNKGWCSDWAKSLYAPWAMFGDSSAAAPHETSVRVVVDLPDGIAMDKTFKVVIKYAATYDLGSLERHVKGESTNGLEAEEEAAGGLRSALQVLDVVLRSGISARENVVTVGSAVLFNAPGTELYSNLGRGAEAWAGYKQAVKVTQNGLALVLDLAAGAFVKAGPLVEIMADLLGRSPADLSRGLGERDLRALSRELRGVRVVVERPGGKVIRKTIWGLSKVGADRTMFFYEPEKKEISVVQYFKAAYGITLQCPRLPCVNVSKDSSRVVWLPAEMCRILSGQRKRMLQDERHTTAMLRFAGLKPNERQRYLHDVVSNSNLANFNAEPAVQKFGMEVAPRMTSVKARILDSPKLAYGKPEALDPGTQGAWNLRQVKFPLAAPLQSWAAVSLMDQSEVDLQEGHPQALKTFVSELVAMCNGCGMNTASPPIVHYDRSFGVGEHITYAVEEAQKTFKTKCQLVLVLLPSKGKDTYQAVKQASDSEASVPTQCFVAQKAGVGRSSPPAKGRLQYCANLALKMNVKVGGTNVKLLGGMDRMPVLGSGRPYMIMGADVTHPTGFDSSEPSIAAVTASYDAALGRYACRVMQQAHRQEIITGLKDATQAMLLNFYKRSQQKKPQSIIYYRDGVDEGQFAAVLREEYMAIRAACQGLEAGYAPPITFVVVQKRHATRLFPERGGDDRSGNTLPGTVLDSGVCSSAGFDFFLNSHAGLQGHNKASTTRCWWTRTASAQTGCSC